MRYQPIPKPCRIRDPQAIERARRDYCEYCGHPSRRPGEIHVHHVRSKGSGGDDREDNLVSLCWLCHDGVHRGRIPRASIEALVEAREALRGIGLLCRHCGCSRLVWHRREGIFRCYRCDAEIKPPATA